MQKEKMKSTFYGIALLLGFITVIIVIPYLTSDKIIGYLSISIYGILKIGLVFYGQTAIKKLNRNYAVWSAFLFFFTSISLIVIGQLSKINKEITIIKLEPNLKGKNINNLHHLTVGTDSALLIDALQNNSFTLNYMINNYPNFIKENTSLFPVLAAYELNGRDEELKPETIQSLDKFAIEKGHINFKQFISYLNTLTPEEINQNFK